MIRRLYAKVVDRLMLGRLWGVIHNGLWLDVMNFWNLGISIRGARSRNVLAHRGIRADASSALGALARASASGAAIGAPGEVAATPGKTQGATTPLRSKIAQRM